MKILIIQQKRIGDVLTTSILANILKKDNPEAQIDYMCYPHCKAVLKGNPFINNIVVLEQATRKNYLSLFKFILHIRKIKYDVVIDAYSKLETNLITGLSGAKYKISYHKGYSNIFYTHNIKRLNVHAESNRGLAIDNRLQLLQPILKKSITDYKPKIFLSENEILDAQKFLKNHQIHPKKPLFMFSILGSEWYKTYPPESMAKLITFTVNETDASILFNYIPNQKDEALEIYNLCDDATQRHIYFEAYTTSLRDFLGILSQCDALIGNEGGSVNMAKALNIPTFSLFSPCIDKEWQIFEDEKNISIHLKDLKPELYQKVDDKQMKEQVNKYFEAYPIQEIKNKLLTFFNTILK